MKHEEFIVIIQRSDDDAISEVAMKSIIWGIFELSLTNLAD